MSALITVRDANDETSVIISYPKKHHISERKDVFYHQAKEQLTNL